MNDYQEALLEQAVLKGIMQASVNNLANAQAALAKNRTNINLQIAIKNARKELDALTPAFNVVNNKVINGLEDKYQINLSFLRFDLPANNDGN